jgi:hypothetical protein
MNCHPDRSAAKWRDPHLAGCPIVDGEAGAMGSNPATEMGAPSLRTKGGRAESKLTPTRLTFPPKNKKGVRLRTPFYATNQTA